MDILTSRHDENQTRPSLFCKVALFYLLFHGMLMPAMADPAGNTCDPNLSAPADHPYGYRVRGNRCEGVYIREVSNTTLHIASLTESFEDYDLSSDKDLLVEWTAPAKANVRLRTHSLRHKLYYRMDAVPQAGSASYSWPTNIIAALNVPRNDMGVIGWTRSVIDGIERNIYIPLRVSHQQKADRSGDYKLVLIPGHELSEVFISLIAVGKDGQPASILRDSTPLGYGYYPAARALTIPITQLKEPGIYYLQIGALLRSGQATSVELWFYHAGV